MTVAVSQVCGRCGTELAPQALACPACAALVHRTRLEDLAARASAAARAGDRGGARTLWEDARALVPAQSEQHRLIGEHLAALAAEAPPPAPIAGRHGGWWARGLGAVLAVGALLAGKLKFLLLGLTK